MGWRQRRAKARETAALLEQVVPLHTGTAYTSDYRVTTTVTDIGTVDVPSGEVAVGDLSFGVLNSLVRVPVPPGRHAVRATTFDHTYEEGTERTFTGIVSLVVATGERHSREILRESKGDDRREPEELHFVSIDAGACGFADAERAAAAFADGEAYDAFAFEVLARMPLPWVTTFPGGGDLVAVESGLGDDGYPVFADYARDGALLAIHVNFGLISRDDLAGVDAA